MSAEPGPRLPRMRRMHTKVIWIQGRGSIRYSECKSCEIVLWLLGTIFAWMVLGPGENSVELIPPGGQGPVRLYVEQEAPQWVGEWC